MAEKIQNFHCFQVNKLLLPAIRFLFRLGEKRMFRLGEKKMLEMWKEGCHLKYYVIPCGCKRLKKSKEGL